MSEPEHPLLLRQHGDDIEAVRAWARHAEAAMTPAVSVQHLILCEAIRAIAILAERAS